MLRGLAVLIGVGLRLSRILPACAPGGGQQHHMGDSTMLGKGYFKKAKVNARRCAVCRWYLPISTTRGDCRVAAPFGASDPAARATWMPTEPESSCGSFSRLRLPSQRPRGPVDLPGQVMMFP